MRNTTLNDPPSKIVSDRSLHTLTARVAALVTAPRSLSVALVLVLLLGAWFRFYGLNWDEDRHLHPDERFLSSVTNDLKWPQNLDTYLDPTKSTLSPYTLPNMGLFVYGTLPVYAVKWVSIVLNRNNYDSLTLVGRAMSGLFDLAAILMLFSIGRRLYGKGVGLLAAALLSFSVLNIQLSHFYAVDTYANLFIVATMYFLVRASRTGRWLDYSLTGLMFGLGLASKLSVFTLAVPILVGTGLDYYRRSRSLEVRSALEQTLARLVGLLLFAALTFRLLQPIAFAGPGFWNWSLNPRWLRDITDQQNTVSGQADLPWIQQWTNRSMLFPLYNIVVWGLGLPLGLASLAGFGLAAFELVRRKRIEHLLPLAYVTATFFYHAATFVRFMRYFLPLYPFLALFAAYLIVWLWRNAAARELAAGQALESNLALPRWKRVISRFGFSRPFALTVAALVIGGTILYALAFISIYSRTNTRVTASRWMYQHIPAGATLANEHWDDWLPIGGLDGKTAYGNNGLFNSVTMANYDDDTPQKLSQMVDNLATADYVVLSSNRLYGSIPRLPMRYPMTIRYYQLLFGGQLGFERIADFTSYPTLFGIPIPDQVAEESFSVYDHPRVQIFKKTSAFNPDQVRELLSQGIAWDSVIHLTPLQATEAPNLLLLSPDQQALYRQAAAGSSAEVNAGSLGSRIPLLAWFVVLELIGLFATPITLIAFRGLADRGYVFGKAVGLLLVAWAAWMIASLQLAPFTWWVMLAMIALLGIASALTLSKHWPQLQRFVQARWRWLLSEEIMFWLFFAVLVFIRMHNPDLWHPAMGGEKPMDLAYLTAITRTPYFPSYDPWFAGGYINYYYFGFVLVATLIHLTGIVPYIAYNLAVPTLFAMTAMGAFSTALNLATSGRIRRPTRAGRWFGVPTSALVAALCGALFVAVIGNLAQLKLLWDAVRGLSSITSSGDPSVVTLISQFTDGLNQWISGHKLPIHTEWWYWNATRVIPAAQGEAGPINEMPFFTFLFADLHAHMMALPYTLLALALSVALVRGSSYGALIPDVRPWWRDTTEVLALALLALTTGALWPINTWDFPTYMLIAAAALAAREYARRPRIDLPWAWAVLWRVALIVVAGWLFFLPFHQNYANAYFGAELWSGSRTPLWAYLLIHGFFLFVLGSYLIVELLFGHGHNAVIRSWRLNLHQWPRLKRLRRLFDRLAQPTPGYRLAMGLSQLLLATVLVILLIDPVVGLALGLCALTVLLLLDPRAHPRRQFSMVLIAVGFMLTALVEIVVLKGDISRMNTVFKFYFQVWVLWAIASAAVLPELAARFRVVLPAKRPAPVEVAEGSAWTPEITAQVSSSRRAPIGSRIGRWWWVFGVLLAACLLYPLTAAPVRMSDRFPDSQSVTLDGTAYMRTSTYYDDGRPVVLEADRRALEWLRQNVRGMPTILEANTPLYRWGSRVSIYTGLPTVIGWDWHQKQQRSALPGQLIDQRLQDVRTMYNSTDLNQTLQLLHQYHVDYVYVGQLERLYYEAAGLAKFDQLSGAWSLVYQSDQVKIYQVH
jgi:YYY domain-containing protein